MLYSVFFYLTAIICKAKFRDLKLHTDSRQEKTKELIQLSLATSVLVTIICCDTYPQEKMMLKISIFPKEDISCLIVNAVFRSVPIFLSLSLPVSVCLVQWKNDMHILFHHFFFCPNP